MITLLIATRNAHKVGEIRAILGEKFHYLTLNDVPNAPEVIEDAGTFAGNATKKAVVLARWLGEAHGLESNVVTLKPGVQQGLFELRNGPRAVPARSAQKNAGLLGKSDRPGAQRAAASRDGSRSGELDVAFGLRGDRLYVLADDSGLEVDALGGAPGVHSARFAALDTGAPGNSTTAENNAKLLRLLKDVPQDKRTARFHCVVALTPVLRSTNESASPVCYADELELQTELFEGLCEGRIGLTPRGRGGFGYDPLFIPTGYNRTFGELVEGIKNKLSHRARALALLRPKLRD
jgi:non-canonical purine NTP pyrophosphatase (RdgB/HAM1 family)